LFRRLALLAVFAAAPAAAQIVTDRPDLTESPVAVQRLQLETGVVLTLEDTGLGGGSVDVAGPSALVRLPLAPGVEARLGLPDVVVTDIGGAGQSLVGDPTVGVKAELPAPAGWGLAAIAEVSLPLGDDDASGPASPLVILIAGRDAGALGLGGQAEVAWDRATDRVEVGGTAVVGFPLAGPLGGFAEAAAGTTPDGVAALVQTGVTLLLSPDLQFDAHLGAGLTDAAPDIVGGVGVSVRW